MNATNNPTFLANNQEPCTSSDFYDKIGYATESVDVDHLLMESGEIVEFDYGANTVKNFTTSTPEQKEHYKLNGTLVTPIDKYTETEPYDRVLAYTKRCADREKDREVRKLVLWFCIFVLLLSGGIFALGYVLISNNGGDDNANLQNQSISANNASTSNGIQPEHGAALIIITDLPPISTEVVQSPSYLPSSSFFATTQATKQSEAITSRTTIPPRNKLPTTLIPIISSHNYQDCEHQYRISKRPYSGVYRLTIPNIGAFAAYCKIDQSSDKVWTVLQRRQSPSLPFWNNTFEQYENGFGDPTGDHWLGLKRVFALQEASDRKLQMKIEIIGDLCDLKKKCTGQHNGYWWGVWDFVLSGKDDGYRLDNLAVVGGNLSDPSKPDKDVFKQLSNGQRFTTIDRDNDASGTINCALNNNRGAWWHKDCTYVALNGQYGSRNARPEWQFWHYVPPNKGGPLVSYNIKPRQTVILIR